MKLFPYHASGIYENSIIVKAAILTFCLKMIMKDKISQAIPVNTDPYYSKALPSNIDYERVHLTLHLGHMMLSRTH
jgi:hypothetical protein